MKQQELIENKTETKGILKEIIETNITRKLIPRGLSWFGCMGGISFLAFLVQLVTGIFLMFYFIPSQAEALTSIYKASHTVPYGWLIHRIHTVGPHIMIGMVFSHMLRILFKRIYKHPRELHWVSGACLLILTLLMSYTGNLLSAYTFVHRSDKQITFIYTVHVAGIPLVMLMFLCMHFLMVRKTGIYEPL